MVWISPAAFEAVACPAAGAGHCPGRAPPAPQGTRASHPLRQHLNFSRHFQFNHFQKFKARSNNNNRITIQLPASPLVKARSIFKS